MADLLPTLDSKGRRRPKYLSPSALSTFEKSPSDYYMRYLAGSRPPRDPQTRAMSVGSSFDAYAKSYLHSRLFGASDPKYEFEALFESQVESQNRDWARVHGMHVFNQYRDSGALADIATTLDSAKGTPRFEFNVEATVSGVPLLGKPDLCYITMVGLEVIHDWKVNGYCSNFAPSPMPGYMKLRPGSKMHKACMPTMYRGTMINSSANLENFNEEWARQLSTYAWCLGTPVGSDVVGTVDQIVCKGGVPDGSQFPEMRIATHKCKIGSTFQYDTINKYIGLWNRITTGYFFMEETVEASDLHCEMLDKQARLLYGELSEDEAWIMDVSKPRY